MNTKTSKIYELKIWGDYACFTRPEFNYERVSYDVITPSAARAIFECICWDHAIKWTIHQIAVLKPIKLVNFYRNEFIPDEIAIKQSDLFDSKGKLTEKYFGYTTRTDGGREQRNSLVLQNVAYLIRASFEATENAQGQIIEEPDCENQLDVITKFQCIFERRAKKGKYFYAPYLGCREFPANYELKKDFRFDTHLENEKWSEQLLNENRVFGTMFYDLDFKLSQELRQGCPIFMKNLKMNNGIIDIDNAELLKISKEFQV